MEKALKEKGSMSITFRKAAGADLDAVTAIYDAIISEEEAGRAVTG